jgi:site-specific DNA recombinase
MEKETVAAYCRVSTNSNDQKNSYENQKGHFERELGDKYNLVVYADAGITGTKLRREYFDKMLFDAGLDRKHDNVDEFEINRTRKPLFNHIYVKNTSRFARNVMVVGILRELKKNGVFVHFLDKSISTNEQGWEFKFNLFMTFDEQESRDKSEKVMFGHREGAKNGNIITNQKLYGYIYNLETKALEIIEEEAEIIRKIFTWYSEGYGFRRIIALLNEKGIKTREGKSFGKTTVSKMLENEKYCGDLVRNKFDSGTVFYKRTSYVLKPREEWIVHENHEKVPAIITKELFRECQNLKMGRSENHRGVYRGKSKYAGLLKCGKCGNSYIRNRDNKSRRYFYNCSTKKLQGKSACDGKNVQEDFIEKRLKIEANGGFYGFFRIYRTFIISYLQKLKEELLSKIDQEKTKEIGQQQEILNELLTKKMRLGDLYLMGKFDQSYLEEKTIEIEREINKVETVIKELSMTNKDIQQSLEEVESHIKYLNGLEVKVVYTEDEIFKNTHQIIVDSQSDEVELIFENKATDLIKRVSSKYKIAHATEDGETFYLEI